MQSGPGLLRTALGCPSASIFAAARAIRWYTPMYRRFGMKSVLWTILVLSLATSLSFGAGIPSGSIYGDYVEARTADVYTGPCFANSEVGLTGELAVFGWKVTKGAWSGVSLDGLGVVGVVRASSTLGDVYHTAYPVKAILIVDSRANAEQRLALQSFAKRM